jgi:hypothetical protein
MRLHGHELGSCIVGSKTEGRFTIKSETAVLITLAAPTKFKASRIRQDFDIQTLAAWREILPSIEHSDVEIAA